MRIACKLPVFAAAVFGAGLALGQITFKDAFSGMKFNRPVYFGAFPGDAKTYVVLEAHKGLALLVSRNGNGWVKDTLVKIPVNLAGEMGLLGIAFHPDFNANRKYYVSYDPPGAYFNMVDERIADATGRKDSGTPPRTLIKIQDKYENHNGGTIAFGPKDGFLYYGAGDGGSGGDPDGNGQNTNVLLGKFLRIDVDRKDPGLEYGIPADNPYAKGGGRGEIFAIGIRNPWKWSFDPFNGDLWVGEVGQDQVEEVDLIILGGNYGWKTMEGPNGKNNGSMKLPVFSYDHNTGTCVIGGVVFRGNAASKYYGTYFTADINTRKFWALKKNGDGPASVENLPNTPTNFSSFGTDAEGRIYAVGIDNGTIYTVDSPDLTPDPANGIRIRSVPGAYARSFAAARGGRLDAALFSHAEALALYTTTGVCLGRVRRSDPALPAGMDAGVYLVRAEGVSGPPDLLLVR